MYQPPKGPVVGTGVVAAGALSTIHYTLLAVTIIFTLFVLLRITKRSVNHFNR